MGTVYDQAEKDMKESLEKRKQLRKDAEKKDDKK